MRLTVSVEPPAARLRASIEAEGLSLGPLDMMIAVHAKAARAVLVSRDRAFGRLGERVAVEGWSVRGEARVRPFCGAGLSVAAAKRGCRTASGLRCGHRRPAFLRCGLPCRGRLSQEGRTARGPTRADP